LAAARHAIRTDPRPWGEQPAFLHFHEDAGDLYVDARLVGACQRMRVTSRNDQAGLLAQAREAFQPGS
jgi:hypothetical protein